MQLGLLRVRVASQLGWFWLVPSCDQLGGYPGGRWGLVMLVGLGNGNDVHETSRVGLVRSDLSVNPAVMFLHQPSSLTTRTCWVFRVTSSSDEEGGEGFFVCALSCRCFLEQW